MGLTMRVQHPVKAGFGANEQALIRQCGHDLSWRQRGVLMLIAGKQDPLAFLLAQAMGDMAGAASTAVLADPFTQEALPPALEGAQGNADLPAGSVEGGAAGLGLTDQLNCLLPVRGTGQPSASSEQKASHFFRSTSKAAISAMAFSLRCSSFLRALI
jgi:hypothetical protein